ncbi:DsrE family protein [Alteromonas sp.]|nr:DsrE family protein [Alteromonas sp.]
MKTFFGASVASLLLSSFAYSAEFATGPLISNYGKHAPVEGITLSANTQFNIAFDVAGGAEAGKVNRKFDSLARFLNMHVANGVKAENIKLALVVHGSATLDVLAHAHYQSKKGSSNSNVALLNELMKHGVRVIVCGQSAAANGVTNDMVVDGVEIALSAMTAHAQLSMNGYTSNPF